MVRDLAAVRERTLALIAHLPAADLERQIDPLLSPLVWDLAHIAAYEDLWLGHRHGGLSLLRPDLSPVYDAFETPRFVRGRIELLDAAGARLYLDEVRGRTLEMLERRGPDPVLHEMVLRHELQHTETMRQALRLGGLEAPGDEARPAPLPAGADGWLELDGGPFALGAGTDGFAYDNERPRHVVELSPFRIARRPVTNATWLSFVEGGGYVRREWWSDEGWAWKEDHDITHPAATAAAAGAPACHLSWFEAEALARSLGARLPTEAEWERASTSDQLEAAGQVWEWTAGVFTPYPGFRAHPYKEYSEVFFGGAYRVLRGGSWATDPRVATPTFRNWDLPERRQIFAGARLAC